jgi:two-component system, LytTR family, sensor kinase
MVKDYSIRLLFIPLLGIIIPFASHIITYENYSIPGLLLAHAYCIFTSFAIWTGCNKSHQLIRRRYHLPGNVLHRLGLISVVSIIYSTVIGGGLAWLWFFISNEEFAFTKLFNFVLYTAIAVTVFTLFYEVVFLNTEKEEHIKLVDELDKERMQAETSILRNELDPHFIFNSLTTLNQLIKNDPAKAASYNENLAQVYKYVLKNKNRETVSLAEELSFIEEYFLLLQIRFGNKLQLEGNFDSLSSHHNKFIIPCALQILIENAVKHNEFSEQNPLNIKIQLNGTSLKVSNNIMPKPFVIHSTETGLNNLNLRYKLLGKDEIQIKKDETTYTVILPLLTTTKPYSHA